MRFKLTLKADKQAHGTLLPLNYQYELASYIYKTISRSDSNYAQWLHENGYVTDEKHFRLFGFSGFKIDAYKIQTDRINILSDTVTWQICFLPEKSTEEFIKGVFAEQVFCIGDIQSKVQFRVANIELLPDPDFSASNLFTTLSPVCITRHIAEQNRVAYESPDSTYAHIALLHNLKNKYKAFYGCELDYDGPFEFSLQSQPKSKLIAIKVNTPAESRVKGYTFRFTLKAHPELMRIMYHCGLGEKNAMGFGMVECSK